MTELEKPPTGTVGLVKGDFAGWIYEAADDELTRVLSACAREGLERRERLLLIGGPRNSSRFEAVLKGITTLEQISSKSLLSDQGVLCPKKVIESLSAARDAALSEGLTAVRVFLDMDWMLSEGAGVKLLVELSKALYPFLLEGGCLALGLYEKSFYPPTSLMEVLSLHPRVIINGAICENHYYCPPDELKDKRRHSAMLDRLLGQLEAANDQAERGSHVLPPRSAFKMLEAIIDSLGHGLFVTDINGQVVVINKTAESILGYGVTDLPLAERARKFGNYLPDMVTPYPLEELPISKAIRGESVDQVELFIRNDRRPEGVWVCATGRPVRDYNDELRGGLVVFRDITEEKRADEERGKLEKRMSRTQKMESLGLLAGGIAHDFNNLLMGVLGNAGLALQEIDNKLATESRLERIRTAATRLAELTNQLLAYAGKGTFTDEPLDVSELVQEMESLLRTVISKKAKITCEFSNKLPIVRADPTQMRQIVMNLITNASDALGKEAGEVIIRTGQMIADREYLCETYLADNLSGGRYVYLEVSDTGCGMDQETQARVFDPFFTTKFKGRGLGLAAVLGLVRRHNGALKVESEPGRGSTFRVLFPAAEGCELPDKEPSIFDSEYKGGGTVLVIDDEEVVRNLAKEMLERVGFQVLVAENGTKGIEVFEKENGNINVVVLDMTMPDMNGEEVFYHLKNRREDVRVILSSGYTESDTIQAFAQNGLSGFLQKPYMPEALVSKVREVVERE